MLGGVLAAKLAHAVYAPRRDEAPAVDVAPLQADAAQTTEVPLDSDEDGPSDRLERRTDTDPFERDSDGDGTTAGQQDQDCDGGTPASPIHGRRASSRRWPPTSPNPWSRIWCAASGRGAESSR